MIYMYVPVAMSIVPPSIEATIQVSLPILKVSTTIETTIFVSLAMLKVPPIIENDISIPSNV